MKTADVNQLLVPKLTIGWTDQVLMREIIQLIAQQGRNYFINLFQFFVQNLFRESTGRKVRKTLKKAKNRSGGRRNRFNPLKSPILQMRHRQEIHIQPCGLGELIEDTLKSSSLNPETGAPKTPCSNRASSNRACSELPQAEFQINTWPLIGQSRKTCQIVQSNWTLSIKYCKKLQVKLIFEKFFRNDIFGR